YTQRFPDGAVRYSERRVSADTVATALFGAMLAVANHNSGADHGFVNHALYQLWRTKRSAYRDIVPGKKVKAGIRTEYVNGSTPAGGTRVALKQFEDFTSNKPRKGYDTVTGLGSPSLTFLRLLP
ncbi:MAG: hypothetical protein ACRDJM_06750, partial [Actinomycetota bacterium]